MLILLQQFSFSYYLAGISFSIFLCSYGLDILANSYNLIFFNPAEVTLAFNMWAESIYIYCDYFYSYTYFLLFSFVFIFTMIFLLSLFSSLFLHYIQLIKYSFCLFLSPSTGLEVIHHTAVLYLLLLNFWHAYLTLENLVLHCAIQ